ncbi:MAG: hypothetical protein HZB68_03160 [Candidatus Aenigmarchaeota archaeon]|nr:hypothetical protein [Candidatus Aenigmarchaeota archaeon]
MGIFKSKEGKEREETLRLENEKREKNERKEMEGLFETYLLTCSALDYCANRGLDIKDYEMKRLSSLLRYGYDVPDALYRAQKCLVERGTQEDAEVIIGFIYACAVNNYNEGVHCTGTALIPKSKKKAF